MKKVLFLLIFIGIVFLIYNRQRVFIRDPLGSVVRDGVKEDGAQVYINYSNDVLLENDKAPIYMTLVQHGQMVGTPLILKCIHQVVCLTDADLARLIGTDPRASIESMTNKTVVYHGVKGQRIVVTLR